MVNKRCPVCNDLIWENGTPVPYSEDEVDMKVIGMMHFCSEECRDEYKDDE